MKFNLPQPGKPFDSDDLAVGNVYKCKGGGKTRYWIVIAFTERTVNLLGINAEGAITSTVNYGSHVFNNELFGRELLGKCNGLEELEFDIEWKLP